MLDRDLAYLYEVETKQLKRAVRGNIPCDEDMVTYMMKI